MHDDESDRLAQWVPAAQAFMDRVGNRPLSVHRVARELSWLNEVGYIVEPRLHEELCDAYAAKLVQVETAADELVGRLCRDAE